MKEKLSITSNIASLAKLVQEEGLEKTDLPISNINNSFEEVVRISKTYKENAPKMATMYVAENLKKDLERLRGIKGLEKIPLTSLVSAILDLFLSENESKIKEMLEEAKGRF